MRLPSPVFIKLAANINAATMSQIVVFANPAKASPGFMTPMTGRTMQAMSAAAPMGSGRKMNAAIVAMNMASSPQA